jgi:hypothetical protein
MKDFALYVARMGAWFAAMAVLGMVVGMLTGCGSDYCSPFDAPPSATDQTTQPVECQAQGCAK